MTTQTLFTKVRYDLSLDAGTLIESAEAVEILPPEMPMLDQLLGWLADRPCKYDYGYPGYALGIGVTALCIRYGTWLSVLMDDSKPLDPRAQDGHISMISDGEMKRINIEASSNLAYLFKMMSEDEYGALEICLRAYEHLPMPQRRVKLHWGVANALHGVLQVYQDYLGDMDPVFKERGAVCVRRPFRALANTVINAAYRNGEIENIHAGRDSGCSLTHRRFTPRQGNLVLRSIAEKMGAIGVMTPIWKCNLPMAWPESAAGLPFVLFGYPADWSLDAQSAPFTLKKEWM